MAGVLPPAPAFPNGPLTVQWFSLPCERYSPLPCPLGIGLATPLGFMPLILDPSPPSLPYKLDLSPGILIDPVVARSAFSIEDSTLTGRDSREPHKDAGARARIDASVSNEWRRRRLDDDARVIIDALSVSKPFAVALE